MENYTKQKKMIIPKIIVLIFLPPYSPELYPAENNMGKIRTSFFK